MIDRLEDSSLSKDLAKFIKMKKPIEEHIEKMGYSCLIQI
jgi:hypothetical protein